MSNSSDGDGDGMEGKHIPILRDNPFERCAGWGNVCSRCGLAGVVLISIFTSGFEALITITNGELASPIVIFKLKFGDVMICYWGTGDVEQEHRLFIGFGCEGKEMVTNDYVGQSSIFNVG